MSGVTTILFCVAMVLVVLLMFVGSFFGTFDFGHLQPLANLNVVGLHLLL